MFHFGNLSCRSVCSITIVVTAAHHALSASPHVKIASVLHFLINANSYSGKDEKANAVQWIRKCVDPNKIRYRSTGND